MTTDSSHAPSGVALVARACDRKQTDLPVTIDGRRRIPVLGDDGNLRYWVDDDRGRELLKAKRAQPIFTKHGRLRALLIIDDVELIAGGSRPRPTRYSHDRETPDNVHGCWTLIRLPKFTQRIFGAIVNSVSPSGPERNLCARSGRKAGVPAVLHARKAAQISAPKAEPVKRAA